MVRHLILFVLIAAFASEGRCEAAINVRRAPEPTEVSRLQALGWQSGGDKILDQLLAAYRPARSVQTSLSGDPNYMRWLRLFQWFDLLGRAENAEVARFLKPHFEIVETLTDGTPRLQFLRVGEVASPDAKNLSEEAVRQGFETGKIPPSLLAQILPPGYSPGSGTLADSLDLEFVALILNDFTLSDAFFSQLQARDLTPAVLQNLQKLWKAKPDAWQKYKNLALALALVFDQQPPLDWPHHQVDRQKIPFAFPDLVGRYSSLIQTNEERQLLYDLSTLPADQLKFVVDAMVTDDELAWARKNTRWTRNDFAKAYSSIRYDHGRIQTQVYTWPSEDYRLATIQQLGGICVDQAYFAALVGKARGLPTLYFSGQGADGGHAWFGYLRSPDRWDLDCGRYENQRYAVGEAYDPQTWQPINDHELKQLSQRARSTPAFSASQNDLLIAEWLARRGQKDAALAAVNSALALAPQNDAAWQQKSQFLADSPAGYPLLRAHLESAIRQFSNEEDLKVFYQLELAQAARASGDARTAESVERQIMAQNKRLRSDLSVRIASARIQQFLGENQVEDALKEYRAALSRLGKTAGGNLFYAVIRPLALELAKKGDQKSAGKVLETGRRALQPDRGSILDEDFTRLEMQLSAKH